MSRKSWAPFGVAAVCLAILAALGLFGVGGTIHSYLAAWLILLALPLGALPLVMAIEILSEEMLPIETPLRRFVALMPVVAVLALPVLIAAHRLYPAVGGDEMGFVGAWWGSGLFLVRAVVMLLAWIGLSIVFMQPAEERRRGLSAAGLMLHLVIGTLAADDWIMAVEPGFASSAFGLLVMVAQAGLALAAAVIALRNDPESVPAIRSLSVAVVVALAAWLFLAFTHYLVVWSANLPTEVAWYLHRSGHLGRTAEIAALLLCAIVFAAPFLGLGQRARLLSAVAVLVLLLHATEMLWLVTPAARGHFSITLADLLAVLGLGGLTLGCVRSWPRAFIERVSHGPI